MTDANPSDTATIADLAYFPAPSGVPGEIIFDASGYSGCCPTDPCSIGGAEGSCVAAYCGGEAGCSGGGLTGASVKRTLQWTPQLNTEWVVPPGGFPVFFQVLQYPSQPADLELAAPVVLQNFGPVYLDIELMPEFVAPTPEPTATVPNNVTAFLGEPLSIPIKVLHRNQDQLADIVVADDPGLPNMADLTEAVETAASRVFAFSTTRMLRWTPHCSQAGLARITVEAVSRRDSSLRAKKQFEITVVKPQPIIESWDATLRSLRVACPLELEVIARDARNESHLRSPSNPFYLQTIKWNISRLAAPPTTPTSLVSPQTHSSAESHEEWQALPLSFPGVEVGESVANQYRGMSSLFTWVPKRGHEGRQYRVCVTVQDVCQAALPVVKCVELKVVKCQACLSHHDTLQSIASQYKTDWLSLYTSNIHLASPDRNPPATPVNLGVLYKVKEGDSMYGLARRFFTTIEELLAVNSDLAYRSGIRTTFSSNGDVMVAPLLGQESPPPQFATSDYESMVLVPGDEVCVVPPVCDVRCDTGSQCRLAAQDRASGGLLA